MSKAKRLDSLHTTGDDGKGIVFRPENHPLLYDRMNCERCGGSEQDISLPSYPGDYFDCRCGHSMKPDKQQTFRMWRVQS